MDRSLQERLVGAAVLVALGVWLIPWVLDGSAVDTSAESDTDALRLPVPEAPSGAPVRRETIELIPDRGARTAGAQDDTPTPLAAAAPQAGDGSAQTDAGQPQAKAPAPAQPRAAAADKAAGTQADTPGPAEDSVAAPVTESTPSVAQRAASADSDILAASPVAGWMVQLGSFSDAGNARRQARRIGTYGHDAHIYEFSAAGGRTMFRVRLGPVETRERAEATASALAAHGFVAQLVAPE
jgi:DedD protein